MWESVLCCLCLCCCVRASSAGPPSAGPPSAYPPPPDRPKFRSFFPSPATVFILFSLSCWSFSLNFGCVFEDQDPQMCTFGLSGCHAKPRRQITCSERFPPECAEDFAVEHDDSMRRCLCRLSSLDCLSRLGSWFAQCTSSESSRVLGKLGLIAFTVQAPSHWGADHSSVD